jgi:hypothetical protein
MEDGWESGLQEQVEREGGGVPALQPCAQQATHTQQAMHTQQATHTQQAMQGHGYVQEQGDAGGLTAAALSGACVHFLCVCICLCACGCMCVHVCVRIYFCALYESECVHVCVHVGMRMCPGLYDWEERMHVCELLLTCIHESCSMMHVYVFIFTQALDK